MRPLSRPPFTSQLVVWMLSYSRVSVKLMLTILLAPFTLGLFPSEGSLFLTLHNVWFTCLGKLLNPLQYLIEKLWFPLSESLKDTYGIWVRKGFETLLPTSLYLEPEVSTVSLTPKLTIPPKRIRFKRDTNTLKVQLIRNIEAKWRRRALTNWFQKSFNPSVQPPVLTNVPPSLVNLYEPRAKGERKRANMEIQRDLVRLKVKPMNTTLVSTKFELPSFYPLKSTTHFSCSFPSPSPCLPRSPPPSRMSKPRLNTRLYR
ncbi:hypothetical protein K7432_007322 [Basidiobolus ranarum]|uniref:Uncharacterized protein n=1 Tax=Basidiobolus ranarum TaxID=34480 RepID=A0ABR2W0H9_9FUNG